MDLQHYWWFILSLLGALLVFFYFVQGGQSMMRIIAKTSLQRSLIINSIGKKWELGFTTLVTFGGTAFAAFPLFYATSFSGALYLWMILLFSMIIQAVSFEFRSKVGNVFGQKTYDIFLMINGSVAPFMVGLLVGTLFTGADFTVNVANISNTTIGEGLVSQWHNPWSGLEAIGSIAVLLAFAVLFLSKTLGLLYIINDVNDDELVQKSRKHLQWTAVAFLVTFITFFTLLMFKSGYVVNEGVVMQESYRYFISLLEMPVILITLLIGVVTLLYGIAIGVFTKKCSGIWSASIGTVLSVLALLLLAGYNNTPFYPSTIDPQTSLTIYNSSSSEFTLRVMFYASFGIPFIIAYIWFVWRAMNRKKVSQEDVDGELNHY